MTNSARTTSAFATGRLLEALPWHAGAYAALMSVALGLIASVGDVAFTATAASLMTLSLAIGYLLGALVPAGAGRLLAMAGACFGMSMLIYCVPVVRGVLLNADIIGDEDLVLCAYMLSAVLILGPGSSSRTVMLFCFVFSLSIMGLVGQTNLNVEAIASFMAFVLFSLFFLGYDNLRRRGTISRGQIASAPGRLVTDQLYASALVFVVLGGAGFLLGTIMTFVIQSPFGLPPLRIQSAMSNAGISAAPFTAFQNTLSLGGGPIPDQSSPVMRVRADRELLYRSRIYGHYDQGLWRVPDQAPEVASDTGTPAVLHEPRGEDGERLVDYTIFPEVGMAINIPCPAVPERLEVGDVPIEINSLGCARPKEAIGAHAQIEGRSRVNTTDPDLLRRTGLSMDPSVEEYAREPDRAKIALLANSIAGNLGSNYDRVMALQSYIEDECAYNVSAKRYDRRRDPIEQFLFERKEGVCAEFASALALLARSLGVPARVASGYSSGEWDAASGTYRISVANAHAWTEVHFPGVGWVPFDPQATRVIEKRPLFDFFGAIGRTLSDLVDWLRRRVVALLFAGPMCFILLYSSRSLREFLQRKRRRRGGGERNEVGGLYLDLCDALSRLGCVRGPGDGPEEFLERIAEVLPGRDSWLATEAPLLTRALVRLRYGPHGPEPEEITDLRNRVRTLAQRAREAQRNGGQRAHTL